MYYTTRKYKVIALYINELSLKGSMVEENLNGFQL